MKLPTLQLVSIRNLGRLCALSFLMALVRTQAAPPELMTYQGFLVDANGLPLAPTTPANYPVIFRIFTASTGGTRLWSEQQIATVDKGNFSVLLGEGTPVSAEVRPALSTVFAGANNADRYMSISVTIGATTSEVLPRLRLLPAPYAFAASSASFIAQPDGTPVISYANNRVEITGPFFAGGGIAGDGAGITGLTAAQIPSLNASVINEGALADAHLSGNVALRGGGNAFTDNQTFGGNLGIGTTGVAFPLTVGNNSVGDKISLWGQSGDSFGFGIQPSLLQIHTDNVGNDIAFGYGSSAAMTETMRIKGNGNVGIGTTQPGARLSVVAPGASELGGSARSVTLATSSGTLGTTAGDELAVASLGFANGNSSSLGIRAQRVSNGADWTSTAIGLGMDVDNTPRAGGSLWLSGNGNVGIGTGAPTAKLEVNGAIKATSIQVTAGFTAATLNGEKPPQTYTIAPGNLASWRQISIDTGALLGDADGGKVRFILRNHSNAQVRTYETTVYIEQDSDFGKAPSSGRWVWSQNTYSQEGYGIIGHSDANQRYDVFAHPWDWCYVRNYSSPEVGPMSGAMPFSSRYTFFFMVPPQVSATIIIYDR